MATLPDTPRFRYSTEMRLRKKTDFDAVFEIRRRASAGPILLFVRANDVGRTRMGISMSRRVGIAPRRNCIKRKLREAFRLSYRDLPPGWDLVVVPRPHEPMPLERYLAILRDLTGRACRAEAR